MACRNPCTALLLLMSCLLLVPCAVLAQDDMDATLTENYRRCLCWDVEADKPCAEGSQESQDACDNLMQSPAFYWTYAVAIAAFTLLLFPVFFALGRCCNCCGGRRPTYGCCCPHEELGRRQYPRETVICARVMVLALFGLLVATVPWTLTSHHRLASSLRVLGADVLETASNMSTLDKSLSAANAQLTKVMTPPAENFMTADSVLRDTSDGLSDAAHALLIFRFLSVVALGFGALLGLLCLLSILGAAVTCTAMTFCLLSSIYFVALIPFGTAAEVANFGCDGGERLNITRQFLYNALRVHKVATGLRNASAFVESRMIEYECNHGLTELCGSGKFPCEASLCAVNVNGTAPSWSHLVSAMNTRRPGQSFTIASCAADSTCKEHAAAASAYLAFITYNGSVSAYLPGAMPVALLEDGWLAELFIADVCTNQSSIRHSLHPALSSIGWACFATFAGLVVGLFGTKRFRSGPRDALVEPFVAPQPIAGYPMDYGTDGAAYPAVYMPDCNRTESPFVVIHSSPFAAPVGEPAKAKTVEPF